MKIIGVIVTYNRKELLLENLLMQEKQNLKLNSVVIIDNGGNDNTKDFLNDYSFSFEVNFIRLDENIGCAAAFKLGIKTAYDMGAEWIYVMDDDGKPFNENTIENLMKSIEHKKISFNNSIICNSMVIQSESQLTFKTDNTLDVEIIRTRYGDYIPENTYLWNGSLISRKVFEDVGFPNDIFAFKGEDVDFKQRCIRKNVKMYTAINSLYYHPGFQDLTIKFLFKKFNFNLESKWKYYYSIRNRVYMLRKDGKKFKGYLVYLKYKYCIKKTFKKNYSEYMSYIKLGYKDAKNNNMGLNKNIM